MSIICAQEHHANKKVFPHSGNSNWQFVVVILATSDYTCSSESSTPLLVLASSPTSDLATMSAMFCAIYIGSQSVRKYHTRCVSWCSTSSTEQRRHTWLAWSRVSPIFQVGVISVLPQRDCLTCLALELCLVPGLSLWSLTYRWPSGVEWSPCPCSSHSRRYSIQISTQNSVFSIILPLFPVTILSFSWIISAFCIYYSVYIYIYIYIYICIYILNSYWIRWTFQYYYIYINLYNIFVIWRRWSIYKRRILNVLLYIQFIEWYIVSRCPSRNIIQCIIYSIWVWSKHYHICIVGYMAVHGAGQIKFNDLWFVVNFSLNLWSQGTLWNVRCWNLFVRYGAAGRLCKQLRFLMSE